MNRKSKTGKQKKIFILGGSSALIIGTIATGLSVGTGTSALPEGISDDTSYFTNAKKAEVDKVITQLGLNKNNFLEGAQNAAFQLINSYKQFDVINSNVTIDQLISRVKEINTIGLYTIDDSNNISRRSLQPEIDHLEKIKAQAEAQASKQSVIDAYYKTIADRMRKTFEEAIQAPTEAGQPQETKRLQKLQSINFNIMDQLWKLNPDAFRDFLFDYIQKWLSLSDNQALVHNDNLRLTLTKVNTANRNNIDYVAGDLYGYHDKSTWNTKIGSKVFEDQALSNGGFIKSYRFTSRGTIVFNNTNNNQKDVVFVKENLTPADFMLFQMFVAGQFNENSEAVKLTKPYEDNKNKTIKIDISPGLWGSLPIYVLDDPHVHVDISTFLNHKSGTDKLRLSVFNQFQRDYFNLKVWNQLIGQTFQFNNAGRMFVYNSMTLTNKQLPDVGLYLAKQTYSLESFRASTFIPYEQEARKYFIEKFYAGTDINKLDVNNLQTDSTNKERLKGFEKQTSLYTPSNKTYNIINKTALISHKANGNSNSQSFKWFVATHYKKNGNSFQISRTDQVPNYAMSSLPDIRYTGANFTSDLVRTNTEADDAFKSASDRMIYDYIDYLSTKNGFNLQDQSYREIFKNVYRFIRSTISFESSWLDARKSGGDNNQVVLNGYNQDKSKTAYSALLTVTSSMVAKYFDELVSSVQNAINIAVAQYATNPTQNQLNTVLNIFNFFQNYINPSQIDVDSTRYWNTARDLNGGSGTTAAINKYLGVNFPNFGVPQLDTNGNATNKDTLTGRSVTYALHGGDRSFVKYDLWQDFKSRFGGGDTADNFKKFVKWFFDVRLRSGNTTIELNATPATSSTNELDKINIGGTDYTINPQYAFGKVLGAAEFTNLAIASPRTGSVDQISISEFGNLGIHYGTYLKLGLDGNFNTNKDVTDANRPILTKEYFNRVAYTNYLNDDNRYKSRARVNPRTAPLSPVLDSTLYHGSYTLYTDDYNSYISTFYTSEDKTNLKTGFPLPVAPSIYTTQSSANSAAYFKAYSTYLDAVSKYYNNERQKRNKALRRIAEINLNTQEDTNYVVSLKDGQVITSKEEWLNADHTTKVTASNTITKIEIGRRKVVIPENSPYIVWINPSEHKEGIEKILPGPNVITNDPEDLAERITTRNLLIKQLDKTALQNYISIYNDVNSWYTSIRRDLNPSDAVGLNQEILNLQHNTGNLINVDGYSITPQNNIISSDSRFPWDNATSSSYNLLPTSYFSKLQDFIAKVKAARTKNLNNLAKPRELTLLLIKNTLADNSIYNSALQNLKDLLSGAKVVNAQGQLVNGSSTHVPLSRDFPEAASIASQAITAVDALRRYSKNENGFTFSNYSNALLGVLDPDYRSAIGTIALIYQYKKFNEIKFPFGSDASTPMNITNAKFAYRKITLTDAQRKDDAQYQSHIDSVTEPNTAFRYFSKLFSPANPESALFIQDRDRVLDTLQDIYSSIGESGTIGSASYDPNTNTTQRGIDAANSNLIGDIAHISPDQRAGLSAKYFDAIGALERIKIQTVNLTAFKNTRDALDFAYTNASISVGRYNRADRSLNRGFWAHFHYTNGGTITTTRDGDNVSVQQINKALTSINALNAFPSIAANKEDYLTALDVMSQLLYIEEGVVSSADKSFNRDKYIELDQQLIQIASNLDNGFTSKPWYADITNTTAEKKFAGIKNSGLRNILLRKIRYLQYLGDAFYIKDNFVPEFDLNDGTIDPNFDSNTQTKWAKFILEIKQQGKSSVNFRQLPTETQNTIIQLMKLVYPVVRYPNDPTIQNPSGDIKVLSRPDSYVADSTKIPTLETINSLRSILTLLSNPKNDVSLLQSEYNKVNATSSSLVSGSTSTSVGAKLLSSVISQTKDFLNIQNGSTNSNSHFIGLDTIADANRSDIIAKTYNEFTNSQISDQLAKLQNANTIYSIVKDIKNFRDQYTKIGINGVAGKKPDQLKDLVSAATYAAFKAEDEKAKQLLENGTIPGYTTTFEQLNSNVNTQVNLAPGVNSAGTALNPVVLTGGQLISDFSTIKTQLETLRDDLLVKTNALTNTVSDNQLVPLLNELNGNPTVVRDGTNVYSSTENANNPNNIVYAVDPTQWTTKRFDVPVEATDSQSKPATFALRQFNSHFGARNAFPESERSNYNNYNYQDFLESKSAEGRGPASLRIGTRTSQAEFNKMVSYLNTQMTTQVMNAIYWANTDFIFLNKIREFLLKDKDSTERLSNDTLVQTRANSFDVAYRAARDYFKTEIEKGASSIYVDVDGYTPGQNLNGKIPLLKRVLKTFTNDNDGYGQPAKDIMIKLYNSSDALQTAYRNQGFILAALTKLGAATDTSGRESYIQAYKNYLNARNALNGTTTVIIKEGDSNTIYAEYSKITNAIDKDWETKVYFRPNDINLRDWLRRAKVLIAENGANFFVQKDYADNVLANLKLAYAAKLDADNNTRVEVITRLPEIAKRVSNILSNNSLSYGQKATQIDIQIAALSDAIGVKKAAGTGVFNTTDNHYKFATFGEDSTNKTGILATFKTLDPLLVKVASTYSNTLQSLDFISSYMKLLDSTQRDPNTKFSNLFKTYESDFNSVLSTNSPFQHAKTDTPNLKTKITDRITKKVSEGKSTTDITTLNDLFSAIETAKTQLATSSTAIKTIVDGLVTAKNALDKLLQDKTVVFEDGRVFKTREIIIKDAKTKIDVAFKSNSAGLINPEPFRNYRNQLAKYFKVLLTLEKTRNLFFVVLTSAEAPNVEHMPTAGITDIDIDTLYNQYTAFMKKFDSLNSNMSAKSLYDLAKKEMLDPAKRTTIFAMATAWLNSLQTTIDQINDTNPNNVSNDSIALAKQLYGKVSSGFKYLFDYFQYLDSDFAGNPVTNVAKVETPINVGFELDSGIRNYKKGSNVISGPTFTTISDTTKQLIAFNGLFTIQGGVANSKLGALNLLLKDPTREGILKAASLANIIKTKTLAEFEKAITQVPAEVKKVEGLVSFSIAQTWQDLINQTKINLLKFDLIEKLNKYLFLTSDQTRTDLLNGLNTLTSEANKKILADFLPTNATTDAQTFKDHYLEGIKALLEKILKVGDQFNNIDKLTIGQPDPLDKTTTVTAANIDSIRNKYLDAALKMVGNTGDSAEISNLTAEIPTEKIRTFITNEVGIQHLKDAIKLKIERKRFEITVSILKDLPLADFSETNATVVAVKKGLVDPKQSDYLKAFANLILAQKALEVAFYAYVQNTGSMTTEQLFALQRLFLDAKTAFDKFASQKSTFALSEQKLYDDVKAKSDEAFAESDAVLSLAQFVLNPNNPNNRDLVAKFEKIKADSLAKPIFKNFITPAKELAVKVFTYRNNENDTTTDASSKNTVTSANTLYDEIEAKTKVSEGTKVSPFYTALLATMNVLRANVIAQKDLDNLSEFDSRAKSGPSFDQATGKIFNKTDVPATIQNGSLKLVDSNAALVAGTSRKQSLALRELLSIISAMQLSTDLINADSGQFNYVHNPASLSSARSAYTRVKEVYDRYVTNPANWQTLVINNSSQRLQKFANEILEKVKLLNQLAKVTFLFSAATNIVDGTDRDLIANGATYYNTFVKEYDVLKAMFAKDVRPKGSTPSAADVSKLAEGDTDYWRAFDNMFAFINMLHNDNKTGPLDLLDNFLTTNINDSAKQKAAEAAAIKVFSDVVPNRVPNSSFSAIGTLMRAQLSKTNVIVKITANLRLYYESLMEEGYRKYLGTFNGEIQARINATLKTITDQFGTSDSKAIPGVPGAEGSAWIGEIPLALGSVQTRVERLKKAFRDVQKYIDSILAIQLVVDQYVKTPTEENRAKALAPQLWNNLAIYAGDVERLATLKPDDTIPESLINFAADLAKLKDVQKNKIRLVQGLMVASLAPDITKINFENIANPYEDERTLLGPTFNLYTALGVTLDVGEDGFLTLSPIANSLFFGATHYPLSSDAIILQLIGLVNPEGNIETVPFSTGIGTAGKTVNFNIIFPGKDASYLQIFNRVQAAYNRYATASLYASDNADQLAKFNKGVIALVNRVKGLNFNKTQIDTDNRALYNGIPIKIGNQNVRADINFEQHIYNFALFISKEVEYDIAVRAFVQNPIEQTYNAIVEARKQLEEARTHIFDPRSSVTRSSESQLDGVLNSLNDARISFDAYKAFPSQTNLVALTQKTAQFQALLAALVPLKTSLVPSKQAIVDSLSVKSRSLTTQTALIRSMNTYVITLSDVNKKAVELQIEKLKEIPVSAISGTQEFILLNQIETVKNLADKILPLEKAYHAINDFSGVLTDRLLKSATSDFDKITTENPNNPLIKALLNRIQIPLKTIEANRNIDKDLSNFASTLTDESKAKLDQTIINSKALIKQVTLTEAQTDQLSETEANAKAALLENSIPSYITLQYIKAAEQEFATFKLFEQYKLNPSEDLRNQINHQIGKTALLNESAKYLSQLIAKLADPTVNVDSNFVTDATQYDVKNPSDNNFGKNTLEAITTLINKLNTDKPNIDNSFTSTQNSLQAILSSTTATPDQIANAKKAFNDANYNRKSFNNLTLPFTSGQKLINPLITLRIDAIVSQLSVVDALKSYVEQQKPFAIGIYNAGKKVVQNRDEQERLNILITSGNARIADLKKAIGTLSSSPLLENVRQLTTQVNQYQAELNQLVAQQTANTNALNTALNAASGDTTLLNNIRTQAEALLKKSKLIDVEALKIGRTEPSRETKLATQALNTVEILNDLKNVLSDYFLHQLTFVSTDHDKIAKYIKNFEQMRDDVVTILPQSVFDVINETLLPFVNDTNTYAANNNYILNPSEQNRTKSVNLNSANKTIGDIVDAINLISAYNAAVNNLKTNLTTENINKAKVAQEAFEKRVTLLLNQSFKDNDNLTSLTSLLKNNIFSQALVMMKAKLSIFEALNNYLSNPNTQNAAALIAAKNGADAVKNLTADQAKITLSVELGKEITEIGKIIDAVTNAAKTGLGDEVEKLIVKAGNDASTLTIAEISALKTKLVTGDKSAPFNIIKARLVTVLDKLQADRRTAILVKDLKNSSDPKSDLSIKYDSDPKTYINDNSKEIISIKDTQVGSLDNVLKALSPNIVKTLEAAVAKIKEVEAIAETSRTQAQLDELASARALIAKFKVPKDAYDAKKAIADATSKQLEVAKAELKSLVDRSSKTITKEDEKKKADALAKVTELTRTLREKQEEKAKNDNAIKLIEDKKVLILSSSEKIHLDELKEDLAKTLMPAVKRANDDITAAQAKIDKVIAEKVKTALSTEALKTLNDKKATVAGLIKNEADAETALAKNQADRDVIVANNVSTALDVVAKREYINNKIEAARLRTEKTRLDAQSAVLNVQLEALNSKDPNSLTNAENEQLVELRLQRAALDTSITNNNAAITDAETKIKLADDKIVAILPTAQKTKYDELEAKVTELQTAIQNAKNVLKARLLEISSDEAPAVAQFDATQKAEYEEAQRALSVAQKEKVVADLNVSNSKAEINAISNKALNGITDTEKATLDTLSAKVAQLAAAVTAAQKAFDDNAAIIAQVDNKGLDTLNAGDRQKLIDLRVVTVPNLESKLEVENDAATVALNNLILADINSKKVIADKAVADKKAQIADTQTDYSNASLDSSAEGVAKAAALKAQLDKLNEELKPLVANATALASNQLDAQSIIAERAKISQNAERLLAANKAELDRLNKLPAKTVTPLSDVVSVITTEAAKEATNAALAAGVSAAEAKKSEILVKAQSDSNKLILTRKQFYLDPTSQNSSAFVKAIDDFKVSVAALSASDIKTLSTEWQKVAQALIDQNNKEKFENNIISAANKAFENTTSENRKVLEGVILDARGELNAATAELAAANAMAEGAEKTAAIAKANTRLANIQSAIQIADKFDRYKEILKALEAAKDTVNKEPSAAQASLKVIDDSLNLFGDDDADPILKLARDAVRRQLADLKVAIGVENTKVALDLAAKKFIDNPNIADFNSFVNALNEATISKAPNAIAYNKDLETVLKTVNGAIEAYNKSDVSKPESLAEATKELNNAKAAVTSVVTSTQATQASKDIATAIVKQIDVLLANVSSASSKEAELRRKLDDAIVLYTISQTPQNLEVLQKAIQEAKDARIQVADIEGLIKVEQEINGLNKLVAKLKQNIFDLISKNELTSGLEKVKSDLNAAKALAKDHLAAQKFADELEIRLSNVELDYKLFNGDADGRALSRQLDNLVANMDAAQNQTSQVDIDKIKATILSLPNTTDEQKAVRVALIEKVQKAENEIAARNLLSSIGATPTAEQIESLNKAVMGSYGHYFSILNIIRQGSNLRDELQKFRSSTSGDNTAINAMIAQLIDMSNSTLANIQNLANSSNNTIKKYVTESLDSYQFTHDSVDAETTLYEGIRDVNQAKIDKAHQLFEKLYAKMGSENSAQYKKLFNNLGKWQETVKLAKEGNIRAIMDINNIEKEVKNLNDVANISLTGIATEAQKYILSQSSQWKTTIGAITASAVVAVASALLFFFLRRRSRRSKKQKI